MSNTGLEYCYECEFWQIQPSFKFNNKNYREIKYVMDFSFPLKDNRKLHIEMKGFETPEFKLKWKLLSYHLSKNNNTDIFHICKSLKDLKLVLEKYADLTIQRIETITELSSPAT